MYETKSFFSYYHFLKLDSLRCCDTAEFTSREKLAGSTVLYIPNLKSLNQLHLKVYSAVSLSQTSDILKGITDTLPLRNFLIKRRNSVGVHSRYYVG